MMIATFKDKMIKRQSDPAGKVHSAIINVSSAMGYFNGCSCCAVYCATKAYVNYFTMATAFELRGQIDV